MDHKSSTYIRNKAWSIIYENDLLLLNAGADKIFAIEDVDRDAAQEILQLWSKDTIKLNGLSIEAREIVEQLKTAQILINKIKNKKKYDISIRYSGTPLGVLTQSINNDLGASYQLDQGPGDLMVIIRTNEKLVDLVAKDYDLIREPHLFVDLAFDHTISVGPLVFPNESACLSCLVGRATTYWGDAKPPKKAAVQSNLAIISGVVALEIKKILAQHNRDLVNNTVAYDFENYQVKKNSIYKLPMCPVCGITKIDSPGSIKLPWVQSTNNPE